MYETFKLEPKKRIEKYAALALRKKNDHLKGLSTAEVNELVGFYYRIDDILITDGERFEFVPKCFTAMLRNPSSTRPYGKIFHGYVRYKSLEDYRSFQTLAEAKAWSKERKITHMEKWLEVNKLSLPLFRERLEAFKNA